MAKRRNENIRDKILINTQNIIDDVDINRISLAQIASVTGVSKGTLYYYYNSKDKLLLDLTDRLLKEQLNSLLVWINNSSKDTSLHRLIMYVMKYDTQRFHQRIYLIYSAINGNEVVRELFLTKYKEFAKLLSELISERIDDVDPDFISWLILLLGDGIIVQKSLRNELFDDDEFIEKCSKYAKLIEKKK